MRSVLRKALRRARRADGYTLIELIVVMTILGAVLTPLVGSFTSALRHEADANRREEAYQNARLAIQRMRADIHCAGGNAFSVDQNAYGGFTLTLTEANSGGSGWCPGVIPAGDTSSGLQWCTVPYSGSTTRYTLYRFLGTDSTDCGGSSASTFQVGTSPRPRSAGRPTPTPCRRRRAGPGTSGPTPTRARRISSRRSQWTSTSRSTLSGSRTSATS